MAMKRKAAHRPKNYPDDMRVRAYELWRLKGGSLYKTWRKLGGEYPRAPHVTTLKRWMEADDWVGRVTRGIAVERLE